MTTDDCSLHMQDLITKVRKGKFKGQLEILAKTSPFLKKPLKALRAGNVQAKGPIQNK